jgi:transposase
LSRKASSVAQGKLTMDAIYVGIDVSKERLDVHVHPTGEAFWVARNGAGIEALGARLTALSPSHVAVEATGGFETVVAAGLAGAGLPVVVVNPAQVRHYAKALGERAKTDPVDARVIALFVAATRPELRPLPGEAEQLLSDLVGRRRQIVDMIAAERQRGQRARVARLARSIARLIAALERELDEINGEIEAIVRGSPVWRAAEDLLTSVPGVGPTTARVLLAQMPELGRLDRGRIASLAGLAPHPRQSGQWKGKSFISGGRASVRTALFMAAQVAKRFNPALRAFYETLLARGKAKMVATIAVARKLLITLNAIIRDQKPWRTA